MVDMVIDRMARHVNVTEIIEKLQDKSGGERGEGGARARASFEFFLTTSL